MHLIIFMPILPPGSPPGGGQESGHRSARIHGTFSRPAFPVPALLPPLCPSVRPRPPLASPGRGGMSEADGRSERSSLRSDKGASASRRGAILRKQVAARGPKEENDRLQSGRALNHDSCPIFWIHIRPQAALVMTPFTPSLSLAAVAVVLFAIFGQAAQGNS